LFFFPDGSAMKTRLTAVLRREEGAWKLVHLHVSVGVPDEEVIELQQHWSSAS
jgi:ketosteroid isomerase-like protein